MTIMTSHQIGAMAQAQSAMFGGFQSYAQQITPPYGGRPGMGYGAPGGMPGYSPGPPPMPPPMPAMSGWQMPQYGGIGTMMMGLPNSPVGSFMPQAFGERMAGAGFAGLGAGVSGLGMLGGAAGVASMFGVGGLGVAALGSAPVAGGLMAAGYAANQMNVGFQQRQGVGRMLRQNFGGMQIGGGGRGGYGFGAQQTGEISTMLREMGTADIGTNMEELTRVMGMMGQMNLTRGVQSAREFRDKFRQTVDSLKEIAQVMNTTLEGAGEFMQQSRQMGFFSGAEISRNLQQTRLSAGMTGMSVQQMQQIGQMGSQMGMAMGMRGRTGAGAAQNIATNIGLANQTGTISDEMMFDATGGLTGAEGVQALTSTIMQGNQKWLRRGAGRLTLAAMWDPESGGINRGMLEKIQRGEISFQEARAIGRRNISKTGGRRSDFFSQEERLRGMAMEEGGGELAMGMLEAHIGGRAGVSLEDPIMQRRMRRMLGYSQSQVEAIVAMQRDAPRLNAERRAKTRQQLSEQMRTKLREHTGFSGFQRRMQQMWEREVDAPLQQIADDVTTSVAGFFEDMAMEMEGRVRTEVSQQTKTRISDWARGKGNIGVSSAAGMARFQGDMRRAAGAGPGAGTARGMARSIGQFLGTRGPGMPEQLRALKAYEHGLDPNASAEEREEWLNRWQREVGQGLSGVNVGSKEQQELRDIALDLTYENMSQAQQDKWIANRSNQAKSFEMAKQQISMLSNKNRRMKALFQEGTWAQKYGRLQGLTEGEGGLGRLGVDFKAMGAGGSQRSLQEIIEGSQAAMEEEAANYEKLTAGEMKKRTALQRAAGFLGDIGVLGFTSDRRRRELTGRIAGVGTEETMRLLGNAGIREDVSASLEVGEDGQPTDRARAAKRRLTRTAMREEGAKAPHEIRADDRDELNRMIKTITEGSDAEKKSLSNMTKIGMDKESAIVFKRMQSSAQDLQDWTVSKSDRLREGMGDKAYADYEKIVRLQAEGNFSEARALEKQFYRDWGGSPEAGFLLANLRESGKGEGFQEGLASFEGFDRVERSLRGMSASAKTKKLLDITLKQFGIKRTRGLLTQDMMRKIQSGEISAEKAASEIWGSLSDKQRQEMSSLNRTQADLARSLQPDIELGEGGITAEELRGRRATKGVEQAFNTRVGGQPKEELDMPKQSLFELKKMNQYLQLLAETAKADSNRLAEIAGNTAESGGSETGSAGAGAPKNSPS